MLPSVQYSNGFLRFYTMCSISGRSYVQVQWQGDRDFSTIWKLGNVEKLERRAIVGIIWVFDMILIPVLFTATVSVILGILELLWSIMKSRRHATSFTNG